MSAFDNMMYAFSDPILSTLRSVPSSVSQRVQEIRLRVGLPLAMTVDNKTVFINENGTLSNLSASSCYYVTHSDLLQTVSRLCEGSLYSYEGQLRRGYITLRNGCRAGVSGCFSGSDNGNMRCYTSVNIRLAMQVMDCAKQLISKVGQGLHNILLIGPPGSGKTTMLRDIVRCYSQQGYRVSVADERGEIAAMHQNGTGFELGCNIDVMSEVNKKFAVEALLKYFNPQAIVFDELSDDALSLQSCMASGVNFITTLHSDSIENALKRLKMLNINREHFDFMVLLDSKRLGQIREIYRMGDKYEVDRDFDDFISTSNNRMAQIQRDAKVS